VKGSNGIKSNCRIAGFDMAGATSPLVQ